MELEGGKKKRGVEEMEGGKQRRGSERRDRDKKRILKEGENMNGAS